MEPSQIEIKQTEDPSSGQSKPVTKRKSRIMFDASADEGENTKTEEEEKAHKLLRTRRQSRGLLEIGADVGLGVPGSGGGAAEDRMRKISEKIAQKVKVENLVRNLKMTELEKFAKNKCETHIVSPLSHCQNFHQTFHLYSLTSFSFIPLDRTVSFLWTVQFLPFGPSTFIPRYRTDSIL